MNDDSSVIDSVWLAAKSLSAADKNKQKKTNKLKKKWFNVSFKSRV